MSSTKLCVCLLALAGSVSFFVAAPHLGVAPLHAQRRYAKLPGRSVPSLASQNIRVASTRPLRAGPFSIPMTFEPNVGQADARVEFVGRGRGLTVFLTQREIAVQVANSSLRRPGSPADVVRLRLRGRANFAWRGENKLRGQSNYFIGDDPHRWRTGVPHFARAESPAAAPGVGLAVYGNDEGIEYDLRLLPSAFDAPGSNALKSFLQISGANAMRLATNGDLLLETGAAELRMKKPYIYEERPGTAARRPVDGQYLIEADGSVGFRIGPHDPVATLVIDPSISVAYATFLGGTGTDSAASIAADAQRNVYVAGTTTSTAAFPGAAARLGPTSGPAEFFVAKIDPAASPANSLVYLTFLGGSGTQSGGLIAVDGSGDIAITGTTTSTDFPVTDSSQPTAGLTSGNGNDVIVSELGPAGNTLIFSTLFGGSGAESENGTGGIALDSSGNVYVASDTNVTKADPSSADLPVTTGAYQSTWDGEQSDAFLAVFQPPAQSGGAPLLQYCSYLGLTSFGPASVGGIAVDSTGSAYIAGSTVNSGNGFPVTNALPHVTGGGASDAFLMKISPLGQGSADLVFATLLGGSGLDQALAVAVDSLSPPSVYVTGTTQSADFPVSGAIAPYQPNLSANAAANAFLSVVGQSAAGATSLIYSTYLGGSGVGEEDAAQALAVVAPNVVYVAGSASPSSRYFPWHDNVQPFNGAGDAFVARLDPTSPGPASLLYATPLGGTSPPGATAGAAAAAVTADASGHAYVAGSTTSGDFPTAVTTSGSVNGFQPLCESCQQSPPAPQAFVVMLAESPVPQPSVYFNVGNVAFPQAQVGTPQAPQLVGVYNGGEAPLTISGVEIVGPNATDFSLLIGPNACTLVMSPGSPTSCTFEVGFTPSVAAVETAVVSISDNAPGSPQWLELTGQGQGPLGVSVASLNFGEVPQGAKSPPQTITLTNTVGTGIKNILGSTSTQFPQVQSSCSGTLSAGQHCSLQYAFQPQAQGSFDAQIQISYDLGDTPQPPETIPATGAGIAPAPVANLAPSYLNFAPQPTGAVSAAQLVTLANLGSVLLNVASITIEGANAADFQIAPSGTTCATGSATLVPSASCVVAVQFAPESAGNESAALAVVDNAPGSPQTVPLHGTATPVPSVQISPSSLQPFGAQAEGTASAPQSLTVLNVGAAPLAMGSISMMGANPGDFRQTNNCPLGSALSPGQQCTINVAFAPVPAQPPGNRSAALAISDNAAGSLQQISLSGSATAPPSVSLPASVNFGSQLAGTAGPSQPVTVTNSAAPPGGSLQFSTVTVTGTNSGDFVLASSSNGSCVAGPVPPGGSCTVQIAFKPAQAATCGSEPTRTAILALADNAPGSPQQVPLTGMAADFCFSSATGKESTRLSLLVSPRPINSM